MNRRRWLQLGGVGLVVGFSTGCALPVIPKRPAPDARDAAGWVRFAEGRYTLFLPRQEMGQQVLTALKQVACEELGIGWHQLDARLPSTRDIGRVRATVGSESIQDFALPLARACATLREAIAIGQTSGPLPARDWPRESLRSLAPSRRAQWRFVGRRVPIEQGREIVTGAPLYAADVRRPGLRFGRVLRAAAAPDARSTLVGLEEAAARAVPGFVALVRDERLQLGNAAGLGIVARTPAALDRIEAALALRWQLEPAGTSTDIVSAIDVDQHLARGSALAHRVEQDSAEDLVREGGAAWDVDLRLDIPLAAHAAIEPRAAVAEFDTASGSLQLWAGTQDLFYQRDVLSKRLQLAEDRVQVHACRVGGAFGGKTICTVELEAALLAQAIGGAVKVQWTRAQEFAFGFHRPPSSHRIRARLKDGRLHSWWHAFVSSHILFTNAVLPPWLQRLTDVIGDKGVARGAALPYRANARRSEFSLVRLPVFTGPWRGLGAGPNGLAIESAIDECARRAGADPLRFRLDHAEHPRLRRVLQRVAEAAGWRTALAPAPAGWVTGRGVACGIYKGASFAAVVAEVAVQRSSGEVQLLRWFCAHDCGLVIHPDQVRAQCEGNLAWGLGMALVDALPVVQGRVAASSFADAPIPLAHQQPAPEVVLVDEGEAPSGAGETAIVAAAAAIANAVRDATGLRPGEFPIRPAMLQAALNR